MVFPEDISVTEFLGRRILRNREGQQHKVDTIEKKVDSPAKAVLSKNVDKKIRSQRRRCLSRTPRAKKFNMKQFKCKLRN